MNISLFQAILWLHVLTMVSAIGALLVIQFALPGGTRDAAPVAGRCSRLLNILVAVGLLAGLTAFAMKLRAFKAAGTDLSSTYHALVGTKILLMLAVGACLGMGPALLRKGRSGAAHTLRTVALLLLVLAAFLGSILAG